MFNTIIINLAGGPGCGKSTAAAGVFHELKKRGYVCELVTEVAKEKFWQGDIHSLSDQIYIFGEQFHKIWELNGKVEYIVTDTCLPLSIHYNVIESKYLDDLIIEQYNTFNNKLYFINRTDKYYKDGRSETEEQAKAADTNMLRIFRKYNLKFDIIEQKTAVEEILKDLQL